MIRILGLFSILLIPFANGFAPSLKHVQRTKTSLDATTRRDILASGAMMFAGMVTAPLSSVGFEQQILDRTEPTQLPTSDKTDLNNAYIVSSTPFLNSIANFYSFA